MCNFNYNFADTNIRGGWIVQMVSCSTFVQSFAVPCCRIDFKPDLASHLYVEAI